MSATPFNENDTVISQRTELVFIDSNVPDIDTLIATLGTDKEIHILSPLQDGLTQIASILDGRSGLDSLHIFSHGSAGQLQLGSLKLDANTASTRAADLQAIGSHLTNSGDILLYGCNVAQGEAGQAFVESIARLTQADVAASSDLTGAAALGGDWMLEVASGDIATPVAVSPLLAANYQGVLVDVTFNFNSLGGDVVVSPGGTASTDNLIYQSGGYQLTIDGRDYGTSIVADKVKIGVGTTSAQDANAEYNATFSLAGMVFDSWSMTITKDGGVDGAVQVDMISGGVAISPTPVTTAGMARYLVLGQSYTPAIPVVISSGVIEQLVIASQNVLGGVRVSLSIDDLTLYNVRAPSSISAATYDATSNILALTGVNLTSGATVDATKLTLTGEGGATYTLTTPGVTASSTTAIAITLNAADQAGVERILNKDGLAAVSTTNYNLSAVGGWYADGSTESVNAITVSNVAVPAITATTYNTSTGVLAVTGTGFVIRTGGTNDIVANKFTFTGEGGVTYTLTDTANVELTNNSTTQFSLTLSTTDMAAVNLLINKAGVSANGGTTYNLAAAEDWAAGADAAVVVVDNTSPITATVPLPTTSNANYNARTGVLQVNGTDLVAVIGAANDIIANKFTLKGEGAATYTLTDTPNVDITSATQFLLTLSATDKTAIDLLINKVGASSTGGTAYNLAAAEDWAAGANAILTIADTTANITAAIPVPTITSSTYNASTGALLVTATNLWAASGVNDDIVANKFTLTGEGNATYTLTNTANVDITSASAFTLTLSATDKAAANLIINKNLTSSTGGTAYNLAAAEDWNAGAFASLTIADTTATITASAVAIPAITSASYDVSTGVLVVTGTGFLSANGAANDIVANKFTLKGQANGTYTLTDTANVEVTSGTSFTITLSATDKAAVNLLIDKAGSSSTGGTTYNLAAAEDWAAGASAAVVVADLTLNGITATGFNALPTLTTMGNLSGATEDTQFQINKADLQTAGNTADTDGLGDFSGFSFVVKAVSSGTLKIGANAGAATAYHATTNNTIDGTNKAFWTPAADANGTLGAFTVVAKDPAGGESVTPVQVNVVTTAVADAPVLDNTKSPALTGIAEDVGNPVNGSTTGSTLVSALVATAGIANFSDGDGDAAGLAITGINANGSLWFSTNGGTNWTQATGITAANALPLASTALVYFAPAANYSGSLTDAITFRAWDGSSGTSGTSGLNASTTTSLSMSGTAALTSSRTIDGSGSYVYVSDSGNLKVINVSNPASPSQVGSVSTTSSEAVAVSGNYAYVAAWNAGLKVVDVTTPSAPSVVASYATAMSSISNVAVSGNYVYMASTNSGSKFYIFDVSNPTSPQLRSTLNLPIGFARDLFVSGNKAYVVSTSAGDGLVVLDISTPTAPTVLGQLTSVDGYAVAVSGNYAYVGTGASLKVVNISDPASMSVVATLSTNLSDIVYGLTLDGTNLYLAHGTSGVQIVDISNPLSPTLQGPVANTPGAAAWNSVLLNGNVFVADGDAMQAITSTVTVGSSLSSSSDTVSLAVAAVADTPAVTGASTVPATQTSSGLVLTRNAADSTEVTHFKITGITNGNLFKNDGTTAIANGTFITFAEGNAGLKFTPTGGGNGSFTAQASTSNVDGGLGGSTINATIAVGAAVASPTVNEDTDSGAVAISFGGSETHYKITSITGGTLYSDSGYTTAINSGSFIAQGSGGGNGTTTNVYFRPTANANTTTGGNGSFVVQASTSAADGGLTGALLTSTVTLTPVADTPSVTNTTIPAGTQSTTGLVLSRNAGDGAETTHFKITGITGGTLYKADGTTAINNNDFITFAEGNAGLKLTPSGTANGSFTAQASTSAANGGLGGSTVTATATVTVPTITSATYDTGSGVLTVTGTGLLSLAGATNDIDVTKLTLKGEAAGTYTLTSSNVEITSGTAFSITLNATDKTAVNLLLNKTGTTSNDATVYNLAAAENWAAGAAGSVTDVDLTNAITNTVYVAPSGGGGSGGATTTTVTDPSTGQTTTVSTSTSTTSTTTDGVSVSNATTSTTKTVTDPVTGQTTTVNTSTSTTTVPIVTDLRQEQDQTTPQADIPLVQNGSGEYLLQATLPIGVGLTSEATTGVSLSLRDQLIAASEPRSSQSGFVDLLDQIDSYVPNVNDETQVTVRTITFQTTLGQVASENSIVINGANGTGEQDTNHPNRQEALVIDVRNLPSGTVLQLNNVEFAIIIGAVRVTGGSGRNVAVGDDSAQYIVLGAEDDELHGGGGDDTVGSEGGNDHLYGDAGNDTVFGGVGNDTLYGGLGDDSIDGGTGSDTASYADATSAVNIKLTFGKGKTIAYSGGNQAQNTNGGGNDTLQNIENLTGSAFNDILFGDIYSNTLQGGAGDDKLDGGKGLDIASYADATTAVVVKVKSKTQDTGGAGKDTLKSIEGLIGSAFNDTLTGNSSKNTIEGGAGDDVLNGGAGNDTVSYANATAGVTVDLNVILSQNTVAAGNDTLKGFENVTGSAYTDIITGTKGNNVLNGGAGADTLSAGKGNDTLLGGAGADNLTGGAGNDKFIYTATTEGGDTIIDFVSGKDKLVFTGSAFDTAKGKVKAVNFLSSTDGVAQTANQHFIYNTTSHTLSYDADGSGVGIAVVIVTVGADVTLKAADILIV